MARIDAIQAWVGLGSNLNDPLTQVSRALDSLAQLPKTALARRSALYRTAPLPSPVKQPDYINAVALLETGLPARELLAHLQAIESRCGRERQGRKGDNLPRTLDLDLLLYAQETINTSGLSLPHPRLSDRGFVLVPLLDVSPGLTLPDGRSVAGLARALRRPGIIGRYDEQGRCHRYQHDQRMARCPGPDQQCDG